MKEIPKLSSDASMSDRPLAEYRQALPASFFDDLRGQNVLEYGPGTNEVYGYHCAESGANVTLVTPSYLNLAEFHPHVMSDANRHDTREANIRRIAETAEDLDLPENHFDKIAIVFSVAIYLKSLEDYKTLIRKVMYSLKPGGIAVIVPMYPFFLRDTPNGKDDVDAELTNIHKSVGDRFSFTPDRVDIGPVKNSNRLIISKRL
jgi:SAM-dependent methyltransferase